MMGNVLTIADTERRVTNGFDSYPKRGPPPSSMKAWDIISVPYLPRVQSTKKRRINAPITKARPQLRTLPLSDVNSRPKAWRRSDYFYPEMIPEPDYSDDAETDPEETGSEGTESEGQSDEKGSEDGTHSSHKTSDSDATDASSSKTSDVDGPSTENSSKSSASDVSDTSPVSRISGAAERSPKSRVSAKERGGSKPRKSVATDKIPKPGISDGTDRIPNPRIGAAADKCTKPTERSETPKGSYSPSKESVPKARGSASLGFSSANKAVPKEEGLLLPRKPSNPYLEDAERLRLNKELKFQQKHGQSAVAKKSELQVAMDRYKEKKLRKGMASQRTSLEKILDKQAKKIEMQENQPNVDTPDWMLKLNEQRWRDPRTDEFYRVHARVVTQSDHTKDAPEEKSGKRKKEKSPKAGTSSSSS